MPLLSHRPLLLSALPAFSLMTASAHPLTRRRTSVLGFCTLFVCLRDTRLIGSPPYPNPYSMSAWLIGGPPGAGVPYSGLAPFLVLASAAAVPQPEFTPPPPPDPTPLANSSFLPNPTPPSNLSSIDLTSLSELTTSANPTPPADKIPPADLTPPSYPSPSAKPAPLDDLTP